MRAVWYDAFAVLPVVADVPEPTAPPGGVVIKVGATGVCRSDWHAWMGHEDHLALPHVPGHEFAGVVAAVSPEVSRWRVGDRVTVPFVCACGRCGPCRAGDRQVCADQYQPGFTGWGSFAEFVAIPRADLNLVALPAELDFVTAAGLGCRFSTAARAIGAQGQLRPGEWLAVHGCGGVGLAAVMIAVALGARVVAVDPSPAALSLAAELGAEVTLPADHGVAEAIRDATDGGAHVSIDAFGSAEACSRSVLSLRPRGRHVQVGLLPAVDGLTSIPMAAVIARELQVIGSHGMSSAGFDQVLTDIARGRLDPAKLVGRVISLDDAPDALAALSQPSTYAGTTIIQLD